MLVSQFAQNPATDEECARRRDSATKRNPIRSSTSCRACATSWRACRQTSTSTPRPSAPSWPSAMRSCARRWKILRKARETLLESIREIERETQVQFNETFERVAAAFTEMYRRLFPGGEAKMWQTQPENLSETGIEIAVQPPGKKQMALAALSGGERAMTAAALIFALIATWPAPFYFLDEVDAALDDANIDKFCEMVKAFAKDSQMLIVTHNKKTMEMADRIYGVTMRDAGVSSIVSAELAREAEIASCLKTPRDANGRPSFRFRIRPARSSLPRALHERGIEIYATGGTRAFLQEGGIPARDVERPDRLPGALRRPRQNAASQGFRRDTLRSRRQRASLGGADVRRSRDRHRRRQSLSVRSDGGARWRDAGRSDRTDRHRRRRAFARGGKELRTRRRC